MLKVRRWAAETVPWMGVEDAEERSVKVRGIAWVAHISGKDGSNVGEA